MRPATATPSAAPFAARGLAKGRPEALLDGIFALALKLLVLDLKLPDNFVIAGNDDLLDRLLALRNLRRGPARAELRRVAPARERVS